MSLNNLKNDCKSIKDKLLELEAVDAAHTASNGNRTLGHWLFFLLFVVCSLLIPLAIALDKLERAFGFISAQKDLAQGLRPAEILIGQLENIASLAPKYFTTMEEEIKGVGMALGVLVCYYITNVIVFGWLLPPKPTKTRTELKAYKSYAIRCDALMTKRTAWYREYQEISINKGT